MLVALRTPDVDEHKGPPCNSPGRGSHLQDDYRAFTAFVVSHIQTPVVS